MNITDEQARIIGEEVGNVLAQHFYEIGFAASLGESVVDTFMKKVGLSNPNSMTSMPIDYLLKTLGTAVGKAIVMRFE
jgi:hypothetical protein